MGSKRTRNLARVKGPKKARFTRGESFGSARVQVNRKPRVMKGHHPCVCGSGKKDRDCCGNVAKARAAGVAIREAR